MNATLIATILLALSCVVMGYLIWTLHSRLRLLERMDATLKLAEKVLTKGEYQAPTAKPVMLERVPRPLLRTKPVMRKREEAKDESTITR